MTETHRIVTPDPREEDAAVGNALRPTRLDEYVGQERLRQNLKVFI